MVTLRHLHLRYAVTRGLVSAAKPSSPPRVTLTLYRPFRTTLQKRDCLLHVRYRDGARVIRYPCLSMLMLSEPSGYKTGPSRSHRVRSPIGPDRHRTLAYGSAYAPTTRTVRMQLAASAVSSSSVDEVQPASCCWCRCRPAGVTAETAAVDQPLLQAYRPARGRRAIRSCASVIPVSLCTGEAFRPRERSSLFSPCLLSQTNSVGRAHHYRKRMYSVRRFRTKLTFG